MRDVATNYTDTFPKLLLMHATQRADRPAMREKDLGIWQTWTWEQVLDEVRDFALGLEPLGLKRDDKVAIIGNNKPRLYWAMCSAQSLGAVPVPVYQDSVAEEIGYVPHGVEATDGASAPLFRRACRRCGITEQYEGSVRWG